MSPIVHILLPEIRSAHNVGSIFRSADCFGIAKIFLTGTTPRPTDRFGRSNAGPQKEIAKTALGAEKTIAWEYLEKAGDAIKKAKKDGFSIISIEQGLGSITPQEFIKINKSEKLLIIMGNEVTGIPKDIIKKSDHLIEIPMKGEKESLNVSVCAGVIMYELLK
jgi:tRNA G18 (ribose-2'-O)-methylase SpoU